MAPVLLIGLDPLKIAGFDPAPVQLAIAMGHRRFVDAGIEVDTCLVEIGAAARPIIAMALQAKPYGVVVVGGGIRKPGRSRRALRGRDRIDSASRAASRDRVQHESDDEPRRGATPDAVTLS